MLIITSVCLKLHQVNNGTMVAVNDELMLDSGFLKRFDKWFPALGQLPSKLLRVGHPCWDPPLSQNSTAPHCLHCQPFYRYTFLLPELVNNRYVFTKNILCNFLFLIEHYLDLKTTAHFHRKF